MNKGWFLILSIVVGILIGGLFSELFDLLAPTGMVKELFMKGIKFGIDTFTLNLGVISFTFGFNLNFTIISMIMVIVIIYYFRWWIR